MTPTYQTLRSAINRADSAAYDAQQEVEKAVAEIESAIDRLTTGTNALREAHVELHRLQRLAKQVGMDHEVPYNGE